MGANVLAELNAGALTSAATLTFTTVGKIQRLSSGQILVTARMCPVSDTAGAVLSYQMLRDGVTALPPQGKTGQADTGHHQLAALAWIDSLPDGAPHSYTIQVTTSAGNISDGIGHASVVAYELGTGPDDATTWQPWPSR